jgi:hypothetical protein
MKAAIRAAGIGFGGTLGAGAAILVAGALVAIATRSAVRKTADDIAARVSELIDQAVAKVADEQPEPDHVHTTTCPCPAWLKYPPEDPAAGIDHTMHNHPATDQAIRACEVGAGCTCPPAIGEGADEAMHLLTCPLAMSDG